MFKHCITKNWSKLPACGLLLAVHSCSDSTLFKHLAQVKSRLGLLLSSLNSYHFAQRQEGLSLSDLPGAHNSREDPPGVVGRHQTLGVLGTQASENTNSTLEFQTKKVPGAGVLPAGVLANPG
jgi:hypothetical protein